MTLATIFLIAALIAFILDAFAVNARVNLVALGLALLTASMLVGGVRIT